MPGGVKIAVGPISVELDPASDDRVVAHHLKDPGGFEPLTLAAWSKFCRPGRLAIDVGAYTGLFAIAAAKLGATAVAFEPVVENCVRLQENARANNTTVLLFPLALSDRQMRKPLWTRGRTTLPSGGKLGARSGGVNRGHVEVRTLDSFGLTEVDVIKMDVERHEPRVITGALTLINAWRPALIAEALGEGEWEKIEKVLPDGYARVAILDRRNMLIMHAKDSRRSLF
jgi:FkbM family methyltransferase